MGVSPKAFDSASNLINQPLSYLEKAVSAIRGIGLLSSPQDDAPILAIVSQLEVIDEDKALTVARVLQQSSMFNVVVREHIDAMTFSDRYENIAEGFTSIREDCRRMLDGISDGKITMREKIRQIIMRIMRGSVPARYERIRTTYLDVTTDSKKQIGKERTILEAYKDYRLAVKSSEVLAYEVLEKAQAELNDAKAAVETASLKVEGADAGDLSEKANLEMVRDEAIRAYNDADKRYQVAKDLAENIRASYATGEVVMARLDQTTSIKERVYQRAVTFFSTNETVFTGLNAATTSVQGLNESTRALDAMEAGINAGIEDLADIGSDVLKQGVRAGYGAGLQAQSVKKLVDSVVEFQSDLKSLTQEMRLEATQNANEIANIVDDGKKRFAALVNESV